MYYFFSTQFLISSVFLSIFILFVLGFKKLFKNHISMKWQYKIWYILFFVLSMPFIPYGAVKNFFHTNTAASLIQSSFSSEVSSQSQNAFSHTDWINDYTLSINDSIFHHLDTIILFFWLIGAVFLLFIIIKKNRGFLLKAKNSFYEAESKWHILLDECKQEMKIKKKIQLKESDKLQTPMIFGLFSPIIVLPACTIGQMSEKEVKYILYHELSHFKNKDIFVNYMICFFQILYWFHPLVWTAFQQMRTERECVCDRAVLNMLKEESHTEYGLTMIHFIESISKKFSLTITTDMGGTKKQIKKRIKEIAGYTKETVFLKCKSAFIFSVILCIALIQIPIISAAVIQKDTYYFKENEVIYEDLSSYFDEMEGSFVLYDSKENQYHIYNKEKSTKRVSPNSTYKIYSALMALETGVIRDQNVALKWGGTNYPIETWNKDQTMKEAMKNSTTWYFNALDKLTGFETIKRYLKEMNYGNCDFSAGAENVWLESSLKISPVEQVELLKDFYTYTIDFKKENIDCVKSIIQLSQKGNAVLSGKTGTGMVNYKNVNGWFIGYVEAEENTYFFALNIEGKDNVGGSRASQIALSILRDKNIY